MSECVQMAQTGGFCDSATGFAEMEILAALLTSQFGAAQADAEQGVVLLEVLFPPPRLSRHC